MSDTLRRVLFLSHSHAFRAFRVGSHHYARELARRGAEVVHLSTPISRTHRLLGRVSASEEAVVPRGAHTDADGVTHIVPRTLLPTPIGKLSIAEQLSRNGIQTDFDAVLIDQPLLWSESIRELSPRLIYRPTDLYPAGTKNRLQQQIVAASDAVIATSTEVLRGLGSIQQPTLVLGNGVDIAHFTQTPPSLDERQPVCVYVGALDGRFDWTQLASWAAARPQVRFVVAGPAPEPPVALPGNVELVGAVSYDALPALLHSARVGMLPLSDDPLNAGRSPMKLYEYLTAGLTVLARETPVIVPDADTGLITYSAAEDAVAALDRALAHPSPNVAGATRAAGESWQAKTDALTEFVLSLSKHSY